ESFVEVSPSIVMRLNDACATAATICRSTAGSTQASVAMKPSMVAMLGRIMPAPLAMPLMLTVAPPIATCVLNALGTVSVVIMASAARTQRPARLDALERQRLHDHTGGERQHLRRRERQLARQRRAAGTGSHQPLIARAGVRIARVDQQGT